MKLFWIVGLLLTNSMSFAQADAAEIRTENYFNTVKTQPKKLKQFLWKMPKGGDLHLHMSGATYAENLIHFAKEDYLCLAPKTYVVSYDPSCKLQPFLGKRSTFNSLIDAWSMRHFSPTLESGAQHFFSSFDKFRLMVIRHHPEVLAEIMDRAGLQNESYLEIMDTLDNNTSGALGKKLGWNPNFATMRKKLLAANFNSILIQISKVIDKDQQQTQTILQCQTHHKAPGCQVKVRYLYQALREQAPEMVFAQLLTGFEIATQDKRVVGLNLVQSEHGTIAMRDYQLHMQMIAFLRPYYPKVKISLHAGELAQSLVSKEGLKFHIFEAVTIAKANRIGHGVDIAKEDQAINLLQIMAKKDIPVEINLSSNYFVLNVFGATHPFPLYRQYKVPIVLSTDDEGINRSNLTKEYLLAVKEFNLDYFTLKTIARNSLSYAFLPGRSLWKDRSYHSIVSFCHNTHLSFEKPSKNCQAFLDNNEKARLQWDLEHRFKRFELNHP